MKTSYPQQLIQFPVTSKKINSRYKVSSPSACCTANPHKSAGRYPTISASTYAKIPWSQTRPFCFLPPLFFSTRRREQAQEER